MNDEEKKEYHRKHSKQYYEKNKEKVRARAKADRDRGLQLIRELKDNQPCTDCGVRYPYYVMDFDHLPQYEKVNTITAVLTAKGITAMLKEIEKCELVCANCHRERTHQRRTAQV